jgi:hypothetical protein
MSAISGSRRSASRSTSFLKPAVFWSVWAIAVALTGTVTGFMLGHALVLGPFLDWMIATPDLVADTYAVFRNSAGRGGLAVFYAVAALQVSANWLFLLMALSSRRSRVTATIAAATGTLWVVVHYASGFGALETAVFNRSAPTPDVVRRFIAWNAPIHFLHATTLAVALGALLAVPMATSSRREA